MSFPLRYIPESLSESDRNTQRKLLMKSKRLYKRNKYYTRKQVRSYKSKRSKHLSRARDIYGVDVVTPTKALAQKTGCTLAALKKIVNKGEGAYYSSGSRPNQTARSWGLARLASSLTAGKSAAIDYDIIKDGCSHNKKAFILANKSRRKYKKGRSKTKRTPF